MEAFLEATALLPPQLRRGAEALPVLVQRRVEELRLRAGRVPTVVVGREELPLPGCGPVAVQELDRTVELATRASTHAALERLRQGWFTVRGGHRLGLCGSLTTENGQLRGLRRLSSLDLRVARAVPSCGAGLVERLQEGGSLCSTLLLAPPGAGKTTLLRDLIRRVSDGVDGPALRVGLADERGEVAALWEGIPQLPVGDRTDVVEGCPKDQGLMLLLRGMGPQVLACDEITQAADCRALAQCANCGVTLLATAHGRSVADLETRPLYRTLLAQGLFRRVVLLDRHSWRVEALC